MHKSNLALFNSSGEEGSMQTADAKLSGILVQGLLQGLGSDVLLAFMRCFLLESNVANVRWQTHRIMHQIFL